MRLRSRNLSTSSQYPKSPVTITKPTKELEKLVLPKVTPSGESVPTEDTQPPLVVIVSPKRNETMADMVKIVVNATDNVGVNRVEFYAGSGNYPPIGVVSNPPYELLWNKNEKFAGANNIPLTVVAYDNAGNKSSDGIQINPSGGTGDSQAPSLTVSEPYNGEVIGHMLHVKVDASDSNGISEVVILVGSDQRLVTKLTSSPYEFTWAIDPIYYNQASFPVYIRAFDASYNLNEQVIIVSTQ
ncbi:MAG: Ig-like domain-containing protein [Candidatus Roizmanbacteria bacterium]|nr:Ig-like domain-containing protein [Candidatus Roizmanbacteria bacterium]